MIEVKSFCFQNVKYENQPIYVYTIILVSFNFGQFSDFRINLNANLERCWFNTAHREEYPYIFLRFFNFCYFFWSVRITWLRYTRIYLLDLRLDIFLYSINLALIINIRFNYIPAELPANFAFTLALTLLETNFVINIFSHYTYITQANKRK